jgi:hypothetical protein
VAALCLAPPLARAEVTPSQRAMLKDTLKAVEENINPQLEEVMTLRATEVETLLELPAERRAALQEVREKAMAQGLEAWRRRAEKTILEATDVSGVVANVSILDSADFPDLQPAWQEGLRKVLSPVELKRLNDRRGERKTRVIRSLTELFLLFLDEKLALSAEQRERLLPIAEKLVPKVEELVPAEFDLEEDIVNPSIVLSAGRNAPEKEVRAILTDAQWARWQKASAPPANQESLNGLAEFDGRAGVRVATKPPAPISNEPVEQTLSKFMAAQAVRQRQRLMEPLLLQIEEAARVAQLSPEVCARLQTGARGAAERALQKWAPRFQQYVRNNLPELTPENVSAQLGRFGNPVVFQTLTPGPSKDSLFENCVKAELTPAQLAAWQKEIDARREFRSRVIIGSVLTAFDRLVPLRSEQFTKLSSMLTVLLADYRDELDAQSTYPETTPWFLQSDARFATLAGLDAAEMEALLGKPRWERWSKTEQYTDARNTWTAMKQNHQSRRR